MSTPRREKELPEYSALRLRPSQSLPDDLRAFEASDECKQVIDRLKADLRKPENRPTLDDAVFTTLLVPGEDGGVITLNSKADEPRCVLVFTDPVRAADYAQVQLADGPRCSYWELSAKDLLDTLQGLPKDGRETTVMFDRCPRCKFTNEYAFATLEGDTPDWLVDDWCIYAASRLGRCEQYREYAVAAAQAGRLDDALQVALEAIGHTDPSDAELHLLIGKLGVARRDPYLVDEARTFLRYFEYFEEEQALEAAVRAGKADFTTS